MMHSPKLTFHLSSGRPLQALAHGQHHDQAVAGPHHPAAARAGVVRGEGSGLTLADTFPSVMGCKRLAWAGSLDTRAKQAVG